MDLGYARTLDDTSGYLRSLREYKSAVIRLFPEIPERCVEVGSIHEADALALNHFLLHYPGEMVALDLGTFPGTSAFCLAVHPKVRSVVGVGPNPTVAEGIDEEALEAVVDPEPLRRLRVLEVAEAAFEEFADVRRKVVLREGPVGGDKRGPRGERPEALEVPDSGEGASLVAFIGGSRTRAGVAADLEVVLSEDPKTIAVLDRCRQIRGPFVQAGVVDFIENASQGYRFRLFGDLGPALASSNLGLVYSEANRAGVEWVLETFSRAYSRRFDPLRLLTREVELISALNGLAQSLEQAHEDLRELARDARSTRRSTMPLGGRYESVNAIIQRLLRISKR